MSETLPECASPSGSTTRFALLLICFCFSGVAALIYQIAWVRQFSLIFGGAALSMVAVICSYMVGLLVGALVIRKLERRIASPLKWFAFIEIGIGLGALAMATFLTLSESGFVLLFGGSGLEAAGTAAAVAFSFVATAMALLMPTTLMGASLPLLAKHAVAHDDQITTRTGLLYTANTLGAAVGTLGASFLLLPALGLSGTVAVGVGINLIVAVLAMVLLKLSPSPQPPLTVPGPPEEASSGKRPSVAVALIACLSGYIGFSFEVVWTRLLSPVLGGTIYAFGCVLATYLTGLAAGAAIAAVIGKRGWNVPRALGWTLLASALTLVGSLIAADSLLHALLVPLGEQHDWDHASWTFAKIGWSTVVLLPTATALGVTFPLCVRLYANKAAESLDACSRVFVWNTLGAIAGAIATGLWLLPALKFAGMASLLSALGLALALMAALHARPTTNFQAFAAVTGLIALCFIQPSPPWHIIRFSALTNQMDHGKLRFYEVGRTTTVTALETPAGDWKVKTDGLPESSIPPPGARLGRYTVARWLSLLPGAVRPELTKMFVVGLGGGLVVEELPETVERVDVVEIEEAVLQLNREFAGRRRVDPLSHPQVHVHVGDARSSLLLANDAYDAIVSQPSHPFTAGGAQLYTREFFQLVRDRLSADGVFVQWMGLQFVSEDLLKSLIATVVDCFTHVDAYMPQPGGAILLIASNSPLDGVATANANPEDAVSRDLAIKGNRTQWEWLGIFSDTELRSARVARTNALRSLSQGAPLITDGHNILETQSPWALGSPAGMRTAVNLFLNAGDSASRRDHDFHAILAMARQRQFVRATFLAAQLPDPGDRLIAQGCIAIHQRRFPKALRDLGEALSRGHVRPELVQGLVLIHRRGAMRNREMPAGLRKVLDSPNYLRERTLTECWNRLAQTEGWQQVREFDEVLGAVEPSSLLFEEAQRVRVIWRLRSGDPNQAAEALAILQRMSSRLNRVDDQSRFASAYAATGHHASALVAIKATLTMLEKAPAPAPAKRLLAQRLRSDIAQFPADFRPAELTDIQSRLEAFAPDQGARQGNAGSPNKL